jgi:hypothetical protein
MKRPRLTIVSGYRPAGTYRFFSRYRNGVTAWFRAFGLSLAVHLWVA